MRTTSVSVSNRHWPAVVTLSALLAATVVAHPAGGAILVDAAYFNSRAHTLVTFEQRGNGSPASTDNATLMPANEYSSWGFTFAPGLSPGVAWINDISTEADAAQAAGGSLHLGIGATDNQGDFFIHFAPRRVTAFGFWVQHTSERSGIPIFDAMAGTSVLESAAFRGTAIDGRFGNIDHGFLGIASALPFETIHVRGDITLLDNFRFIAIAEPDASRLVLLAGVTLGGMAFRRTKMLPHAWPIT